MKSLILITFLLNCLLSYAQVTTSTIDSLRVELKKATNDKQRIEVYKWLAYYTLTHSALLNEINF